MIALSSLQRWNPQFAGAHSGAKGGFVNGYDSDCIGVYTFDDSKCNQLESNIGGDAVCAEYGQAISLSSYYGSIFAVGAPYNDSN